MAASIHVPSFPETSAESLALQACDEVDSLHELQNAYTGLEKLIASQHLNDTEEICTTRTELSALVRVVNGNCDGGSGRRTLRCNRFGSR